MSAAAGATAVAVTADEQLTELYESYGRPLLNYLVKLTLGDRRLAEDIHQETFIRAWRHLSNHDVVDLEAFRPWLYTVARRLVIDSLRARRARPPELMVDDLSHLPVTEDATSGIAAAHALREAMLKISTEHRYVLIELYYHGRTPTEVANALGIPVGTVKSRAYYARLALRTHLDGE